MKALLVKSIVTVFLFASCGKEELKVTNPEQAILGKWEIIENSFGPITYPGSYREFRSDSILLNYVNENDFAYSKYWMDDSVLFIKSTYYINEGPGYEDTLVITEPNKYKFLSYNKLMLDLQQPALVTKFIYKRIK